MLGPILFSFDRKKIYNFWSDYPHKLTAKEKQLFDDEFPDLTKMKQLSVIYIGSCLILITSITNILDSLELVEGLDLLAIESDVHKLIRKLTESNDGLFLLEKWQLDELLGERSNEAWKLLTDMPLEKDDFNIYVALDHDEGNHYDRCHLEGKIKST